MTEPEYQVSSAPRSSSSAEELGDELPATLPVLPLKETVVFPESMTPLAIGQERSIRLIDDVVGGDRLLALVTVRDEDVETPGWDDLYDDRDGGGRPQDDPRPRRDAAHPRAGPPPRRLERRVLDDDRTSSASSPSVPDVLEETREVEALTRNVQTLFARIIGLVPYLPGGAADRRRERRRPERALPPRRVDAAPEDRGEAEAARARRRRGSGCARSR